MAEIVFAWRDPMAVLEVTGPDAACFLQGQFTNDLSPPADLAPCVYGLWLNVKGRVLADSHVLRLGAERFLVVSFDSAVEVIRRRLEDFIIADEVEVADLSDRFGGMVVWGEDVAAALASAGLEAVPERGRFSTGDGCRVFRSRDLGRVPSWHVLYPRPAGEAWRERSRNWKERDSMALAVCRCRAGIPVIPREIGPGDLPNEAGLEAEAISYTKGCYLGQEVMARLKNLGQVRRRLFVVNVDDAEALPEPEAAIAVIDRESGKSVGELRSLYWHEGEAVGMGMLQVNAAAPGKQFVLEGAGTLSLTVIGLAEGRTG